jgi:hypothetical protein
MIFTWLPPGLAMSVPDAMAGGWSRQESLAKYPDGRKRLNIPGLPVEVGSRDRVPFRMTGINGLSKVTGSIESIDGLSKVI